MFLTAMAGNPIAQSLAEKTAHVHITWMNWFIAAIVPGHLFQNRLVQHQRWY